MGIAGALRLLAVVAALSAFVHAVQINEVMPNPSSLTSNAGFVELQGTASEALSGSLVTYGTGNVVVSAANLTGTLSSSGYRVYTPTLDTVGGAVCVQTGTDNAYPVGSAPPAAAELVDCMVYTNNVAMNPMTALVAALLNPGQVRCSSWQLHARSLPPFCPSPAALTHSVFCFPLVLRVA